MKNDSRLRWKPSFGEEYFTIHFGEEYNVIAYNWVNDSIDNNFYKRGLVFKTREEAEEVAKTMLDSIKEK